jgi:heptosyltransferase II
MATPALDYLRKAFPSATITALGRPSVIDVMTGHDSINELVSADDRVMPVDLRQRLKGENFDLAVIFPNTWRSAWLPFRLGIPQRVGYARGIRGMLLNRSVRYDKRRWQTPTPRPLSKKSIAGNPNIAKPGHMVEYYLQLAVAAAAFSQDPPPVPAPEQIALSLPVKKESIGQVAALLVSENLDGMRLAAINPGAAYGNAKRWPLERLAVVADALSAQGYAVVSTASKFETELNVQLTSHAKCAIHCLGEKLDLPGLVALLDRVELLVTNDSGAMHIAAARAVPTVAIFGPTDWNVTRPWQDATVIMRQSPPCAPCFLRECPIAHPCMRNLHAEAVIEAASQVVDMPNSAKKELR